MKSMDLVLAAKEHGSFDGSNLKFSIKHDMYKLKIIKLEAGPIRATFSY
jgi:hypothetical protein